MKLSLDPQDSTIVQNSPEPNTAFAVVADGINPFHAKTQAYAIVSSAVAARDWDSQ